LGLNNLCSLSPSLRRGETHLEKELSSSAAKFVLCSASERTRTPSTYGKIVIDSAQAVRKILNRKRGKAFFQSEVAPMSITVLLADDSEVFRRSVRRFLEDGDTEIEIVGETSNFAEALQMTRDLRPQILLMDLHLDDSPMFSEQLKVCLNSDTALLAMSFSNDAAAKTIANGFGAAAFMDKMNLTDELIPTILRLADPAQNAAP
jgi:CheY-like chemotaxis protein